LSGLGAASQVLALAETIPFDEERWNQWVARGRAADRLFHERVSTIALVATTTVLLLAALWTLG
jgi:hypothetical protein